MLNTKSVYLVIINTDILLQNVAYGVVKDEDTKTIGWYDGERFRITGYDKILEETDSSLKITTKNGDEISWEIFTVELFEKHKKDVFMADKVLNKSFTSNKVLQEFLNGLKDIE